MKKLKEMIPMIMNALIGAVCGIMMMQSLENTLEGQKSVPLFISVILLDIVLMYAAYMLQVIIHEGGHYLFGKLSGYRFSSFRILNLMWKKEDGHIVLKKFSLAGTGGQCLMEPPGNGDEPFPFILSPLLVSSDYIINLHCFILCRLLRTLSLLKLYSTLLFTNIFLISYDFDSR